MTGFDFFLCLEGPKFDPDRTHDDMRRHRVVLQCTQDVLWAVSNTINNRLNALIVSCVPNLDHLVRAKTDQMVPVLIDVKVRDRGVMTVQMGQLLKRVGLPKDNVTLHTATRNLFVLDRVHKAVDSFEMQVERFLSPVVECLQLVHVDEAVQGRGDEVVQVFVVLDLCDPSPMTVDLDACETLLLDTVLRGLFEFESLPFLFGSVLIMIQLILPLFFQARLLDRLL